MICSRIRKIAELEPGERPRERLRKRGVGALSDIELLALMLGAGNGKREVTELAADLLKVLDGRFDIPNLQDLIKIDGIGLARAARLIAVMEFTRRRLKPANRRIDTPADVMPLLVNWADRPQEHFMVLSLNGAHEVIRIRVISQGTLNRTVVHPREVFSDPIADRAAAIICGHNHPSGSVEPSPEDRDLTTRLCRAGELLGIPVLDHIVFTETVYYSFLENGCME